MRTLEVWAAGRLTPEQRYGGDQAMIYPPSPPTPEGPTSKRRCPAFFGSSFRGIMLDMVEQDFAWLTEHGAELLRDYAGKWVAVADGKVVGVGDTESEADAQASANQPDREFILEHVMAETDVIYELS